MPVIIPFTFVGGPGNKAKASQVNACFQAVAGKFTNQAGGIGDGDVWDFADLNANKLSATPGKRINSTKFEVGAVDSAALKAGTVAPFNDAAVNTSNHIKNGIVTRDKLKMRTQDVVAATTLIAPATLPVEMAINYPSTTDLLIAAYLEFPTALKPVGAGPVLSVRDAKRWLKVSFDSTSVSPGVNQAYVQIANNHASSTIDIGAGCKAVFVFLQN